MWIPESFADNDLFEMIRDEGGDQAPENCDLAAAANELTDQVEKVDLMDDFTHPKTGMTGECRNAGRLSALLGRKKIQDVPSDLARHVTDFDERGGQCQARDRAGTPSAI